MKTDNHYHLTDWDQWLGDTVIASAILYRLLHHADQWGKLPDQKEG